MKMIRVEEVYKLYGMASVLMEKDISLEEVITKFTHDPGCRAVFLVDSLQRFAGIITRIDLMKWMHRRVFGQEEMRTLSVGGVLRLVIDTKVKDLAQGEWRSLGVNESDTLQTALNQMVEYQEDVIPVLDEEGHILGDLRISEVLFKALTVGKQAEQ